MVCQGTNGIEVVSPVHRGSENLQAKRLQRGVGMIRDVAGGAGGCRLEVMLLTVETGHTELL